MRAKRRGKVVSETKQGAGLDLMQRTVAIVAEVSVTQMHLRPVEILVDRIGPGLAIVDRLRRLSLPARGVDGSEAPR